MCEDCVVNEEVIKYLEEDRNRLINQNRVYKAVIVGLKEKLLELMEPEEETMDTVVAKIKCS